MRDVDAGSSAQHVLGGATAPSASRGSAALAGEMSFPSLCSCDCIILPDPAPEVWPSKWGEWDGPRGMRGGDGGYAVGSPAAVTHLPSEDVAGASGIHPHATPAGA